MMAETIVVLPDTRLLISIEALYLQDKLPDMHLITISVEGIMPMTVELSDKVERSIPVAIEQILKLAAVLHQEK
jgi:hydrogenase maturation protease